jgi:hypothetical protein
VILSATALAAPAAIRPGDEYHDPAWLVQRAWSAYRLPRLQAMIRAVIGELQAIAPLDVLGKDGSRPGLAPGLPDPVSEALRACSEELRDACGIAGAGVARAAHCSLVRRYISQQPEEWEQAFGAALDKYRHSACSALQASIHSEAAVT